MTLFSPQELAKNKGLPLALFLCHFSFSRGHRILYSDPPELKDDSAEIQTLSVHSIWHFTDEVGNKLPQRIDLDIKSNLYAGTQISLNGGEKPDEKFVLMIKAPHRSGRKIDNLLQRTRERIIEEIGSDLQHLIKREISESSPIRKPNYKERITLGNIVDEKITKIWNYECSRIEEAQFDPTQGLIVRVEEGSVQNGEATSSDNPILIEHENTKPFQLKKVDFLTINLDQDTFRLNIRLFNGTENNLSDTSIKISQVKDFFQELLWEEKISYWPLAKNLSISFPCAPNQEYILTLRNRKKKLLVKKLKS